MTGKADHERKGPYPIRMPELDPKFVKPLGRDGVIRDHERQLAVLSRRIVSMTVSGVKVQEDRFFRPADKDRMTRHAEPWLEVLYFFVLNSTDVADRPSDFYL